MSDSTLPNLKFYFHKALLHAYKATLPTSNVHWKLVLDDNGDWYACNNASESTMIHTYQAPPPSHTTFQWALEVGSGASYACSSLSEIECQIWQCQI
jgi:hypothetical protein